MALHYIGNASVNISHERRKSAIGDMYPKLVDLAEKDSIYSEAVPTLCGDYFCKGAKEARINPDALTKPQAKGSIFREGAPSLSNEGAATVDMVEAGTSHIPRFL